MTGRIKLTDAQKQIAQKYNPNIEAQNVSRPNWSDTYQKQQEQKSASAYEKRQSELAEQRRQAQVDLDVDTINRIDAELKALRAQAGQQTAADRIGDTIGASASGTVGTVANSAGTIINLFQDPEKNKRDIARLQAALNTGYTSDGKPVTAEQRKTIEESIARLQAQTAAWEKSDSTVNKMYNFADIADKDTERFTQSAKQGLGKAGQFAVDLGVGAGQLATDIAASALVPGAGTALMATRVFGGTTQDARQEGSSLGQQLAGGLGKAGVAVLTGKLANIAGPFKGAYGKGFFDDALSAITAKPAGKLVMSMLSEGSEEFIEALADPIIEKMTYNKDSKYDAEWFADALYSAAIGATLGLVGGVADVTQNKEHRNTVQGSSATIPIVLEGSNTLKAKVAQNAFKSDLSGNESVISNDGLGAANVGSVNTAYDNLQAQSDKFYPEGANVAEGRHVGVPTTDAEGKVISRFASNVMGAEGVTTETVETVQQMVADGLLSDNVLHNTDALANAENTINKIGIDAAMEQLRQAAARGETSPELVAMMEALLIDSEAASTRNEARSAELVYLGAQLSRSAARATQLLSHLRKMSPTYQLEVIRSSISNMVPESVTGSPEWATLEQRFLSAQTDAERNAAIDDMQQFAADNMTKTFGNKLADWVAAIRYMNMLGNFRTPGRNVLGNIANRALFEVDNALIAMVERLSGNKLNNTRSVFVGRALKNAAKADADAVASQLLEGGGKYADARNPISKNAFMRGVAEKSTVFGDIFGIKNPLELGRKAVDWMMNNKYFGDEAFLRNGYARFLGGYLQANGVTAEQWSNPEWQKANSGLANAARDNAIRLAKEAAFRQDNAFSAWVSKIGRRPDTPWYIRTAVEGTMPFRKTPANVAVAIAEHSPAGIANAVIKAAQRAKGSVDADGNPKATGTDILESVAKSVSGSALIGLGIYLAKSGLLRGGKDEDDKQAAFDNLLGHQDYAIELEDGTSFTIDWLAPAATPVVMGAELYRRLQNEGFGIEAVLGALTAISDPMLEMSFISGLQDAIDEVKYSEDGLEQIALSAMLNYLTQIMTSTIGGQLERSTQEESMMTYVDKNSSAPTFWQEFLGKASAKIPGWDYQQIPYIDAWGQTESTGDPLERAANNLFNPAYMSTVEVDKVESELQRLYDATGKSVFPERARKYFTVKGERKDLTADEYVKYAKAKGENSYKLVQQAQNSAAYKNMSNDQKAEFIDIMYAYADYKAKRSVESKYADDTYEKYERAEKAGMTPAEYYVMKQTYDYDGSNKSGQPTQKEAKKYLDTETDLTRSQKADLWVIINKSWEKDNPYD